VWGKSGRYLARWNGGIRLTRQDYSVTRCYPFGMRELEEWTWCTMLRSVPAHAGQCPRLGRGRNPERVLPKSYDLCNPQSVFGRDHDGLLVVRVFIHRAASLQ
jgi:hypothetical protein